MTPSGTNITIVFLDHTSVEEVAKLTPREILVLQEQLKRDIALLKKRKQLFEDGVELKYRETIKQVFINCGKDTGTVQFEDRRHIITVEVPKKVVWDDEILAEAIAKIPVKERDEYVTTSYKIEENKYKHWPRRLQEEFKPARTVKTGKPKIAVKEDK